MTTCFVVQGFGKKTDFTDGRVLDLDASYAIIKEAVEASNLECIRADEIPHSGTIDVPMYKLLLQADLVIADLSTYNVNAAFELGVRYGLRPSATIIVAEEGFKNPFDVGHIVIRRYKHLGEDIGAKEAKRFRDDLKQAIADILAAGAIDSPVYTFLPELTPPRVERAGDEIPTPVSASIAPAASPAVPPPASPLAAAPAAGATARGGANLRFDETMAGTAVFRVGQGTATGNDETLPQTAKANLEQAQAKLLAGEFADACRLLKEVQKQRPNDSFVIQQLALSTYKSRQPTPEAALTEARDILLVLNPETTNDPETLGLWGAIHKRLWEIRHLDADLGKSIDAYRFGAGKTHPARGHKVRGTADYRGLRLWRRQALLDPGNPLGGGGWPGQYDCRRELGCAGACLETSRLDDRFNADSDSKHIDHANGDCPTPESWIDPP